jgi:hypothetical protein
MDAFTCPKGHNSIESDYCSECGAKIPGAPTTSSSQPLDATSGRSAGKPATEHCPACAAPREIAGLAFCEMCGWDFANGPAPGSAPAIAAAPPTDPAAETPAAETPAAEIPPAAAPAPAPTWTANVEVDLLLRQPSSPFPPPGILPLAVPLTQPVSLIGRRSEARAIFPEIALAYDDAVSHRHALFQLDSQGALLLRDIGSSNGTRLNGQEIAPMQDYPIHDGDQITLGHFTRITVKAVQQ